MSRIAALTPESALPLPASATRQAALPPITEWQAVRFSLRYRSKSRDVIVLAPYPEYSIHGTGAAPDEDAIPKPLDRGSAWLTRVLARKRPSGGELTQFYTEMERCLRAGLSEAVSLKLVTPLCQSPFFRGVISGLRYLMERHGLKLGDAMSTFPTAFDPVAVALVRAGELSGKQDAVFARLAKRTAAARSLMRKFYSAMVTPAITLSFLLAAVLTLHFQVFPDLEKNFRAIRIGSGVLPWPTRLVVGASDTVRENPWLWTVPIGVVLAIALSWRNILSSPPFQRSMVRLPFVGRAYRLVIMARSLDALALLNAEAVPLERCYSLAASVAGQYEYRDYFLAVYAEIARGRKPFSAFLAERHRIGPEGFDLAARMEAASVTGEISESLRISSVTMLEIADARVEALPKLIGPAVNVIATVVIGLLVTAVLLPTFSLLIEALRGGLAR